MNKYTFIILVIEIVMGIIIFPVIFESCSPETVIYCEYEIAEPENYVGDIWTNSGMLSELGIFNFPYNGFQLEELEQTLLDMEEVNSVNVYLDPLNRRITIEIESSITFQYVEFWGDPDGITTIVKPFSGGC